ncbi:bifunctional oligoribonuclease/PAP phosphatase NrnA [Ruminococcus sp.]|uniref:DHH family phosphoesterase n=1 Tax=Ruminococcus sp. TaxID=41978 RepID=UPI001B28932F|nr:bifunctional oligoribonuclease/PAP phosphatase NrnA [Ruminococcus sp.]MBO5557887.1 bifunctional oligoribonuclease/PAP phosphatase NrnA [Ruminococcus sp.]
MEYSEIIDIFESHDKFLIITHKSPDGDTLGSGFGLCYFLREMGKMANVVNSDGFPDRYDFMYVDYAPQEFEPEYIIAVDVADPALMGSGLAAYQEKGVVDLCIDHHISNKHFAKLSHVEGDTAAAAHILYKIFKSSGRRISDITAKCLYTGIATDTGCFKYENTRPDTHLAAAELMAYDIDFANVNRRMFDVKSKGRIKIEQIVTGKMEYHLHDRCAMICITTELMESCGVDQAEFDGLASIPLSAEGVVIGITVKQRHERVFKISVRTTEEMDASSFCNYFGGGGHIRAAGCEIRGTLEEVKAKLLERAEQVLGK